MARNCNQICKEYRIISGRDPYQMYFSLGFNLVTTLSNRFKERRVARGAPGAHSRFTVVLPLSFFLPTKKKKRLAEHIHEALKTIEQALIYILGEVTFNQEKQIVCEKC